MTMTIVYLIIQHGLKNLYKNIQLNFIKVKGRMVIIVILHFPKKFEQSHLQL